MEKVLTFGDSESSTTDEEGSDEEGSDTMELFIGLDPELDELQIVVKSESHSKQE